MVKYALLIGAVALSAPALSQTAPAAPSTMSAQSSAPMQTSPQPAPAGAMQAAPSAPVAPQPVTENQVARIIDAEFPTYDKNGDSMLSAVEFGTWMTALKSKSGSAESAATPESRKWLDAAFAQADTDKSKSLTKTELTGFLTKAHS